ncbi:Fungal-trans domain-containing protein [Fusarium sp. LHS14.1]|nr:Fungal-trans domain-containing protein [Fusarium sp. LHS14.1]
MAGDEPRQPAQIAEPATDPGLTRKACDSCRIRKIRFDRNVPCSTCERQKIRCTISPRRQRPKVSRHRNAASVYGLYSQGRIDELDERLARMSRLVDTLMAGENASSKTNGSPSTSASASPSPAHLAVQSLSIAPSPTDPATSRLIPQLNDQDQNGRQYDAGSGHGKGKVGVEGSSSLSSHSIFAVNFLHKIAGESAASGVYLDTNELLEAVGHVVDTLQNQQESLETGPIMSKEKATAGNQRNALPPIEKAVAVMRTVQAQNLLGLAFFCEMLRPHSLHDLCLRVYFSDYSESDYIILNIALYFLFRDHAVVSSDETSQPDAQNLYHVQCASNAEQALSALPLHAKPTYDMVIALIFGAIYFVEILRPSYAWTFITAAQQTSLRLGFHTEEKGADQDSSVPNNKGLLFWVIYFFEKSLSLRLGRSSTIPPYDITVPYPGGSDLMPSPWVNYCRLQVIHARLAGAVYDSLYCAYALRLSDGTRRQRVLDLSNQLLAIREKANLINENLHRSEPDKDRRRLISFLFMSDDVTYLSLLTLIHRSVPSQSNPTAIFTTECISAARAALDAHQKCALVLDKRRTPLLTTYLSWTILFLPFVPFIVLFCHIIETGDKDNLARLDNFVKSIESASQYSKPLMNHHRLFHVFHSVAQRYTKLKASLSTSQQGQLDLNAEMDAYVNSIWSGTQGYGQLAGDSWGLGMEDQVASDPGFLAMLPLNHPDSDQRANDASGLTGWPFDTQTG